MKYTYKGVNDTGQHINGELEAADPRVAAAVLREQKLTPISVSPKNEMLDIVAITGKFGGISSSEVTNFTRQLSTMITAGLPLTDALNLLKLQSGPKFSVVVNGILSDVQGGVSLSEALGRHPDAFSKIYVASVKAGEAAGIMDTILNRLADTMEKSREFNAKVKGAMIYPVIIFLGMIGVMMVMMIYVVPKLKDLYAGFNTELPFATKLIIGMSGLFTNPVYFTLMVLAVVGGYLGLRAYIATSTGRKNWDIFLYKLPIAGPILEMIQLTELTRVTSLLVGAGVSIVDALNIVADSLGSSVMRTEIQRIARQVEKGFPVSVSFTESGKFPPIVGQMVAVGEETGKMDEVLAKLSHYYENESEEKVKGLTTAMEPLIILIMGLGVGFLGFAIILPIYGILNKI